MMNKINSLIMLSAAANFCLLQAVTPNTIRVPHKTLDSNKKSLIYLFCILFSLYLQYLIHSYIFISTLLIFSSHSIIFVKKIVL